MLKKIFISIFLLLLSLPAVADTGLQKQFLGNKTVIMAVNIRTFNAKDKNGNEIIDSGEESGNFINAIERLDEIKSHGINVLHLLPVTPVGKLKALGTAGSVYAISDFSSINEQLVDVSSRLSPVEQAKMFAEECHKRGIKLIIDLPSCGSYDLFLKHPELFIKDERQCSVVPSDWTDVRLLNAGNNDKINNDLMLEHKKFIDMVLEIGFDGIRADVATIKPYKFWEELIKYTREKNNNFMFLAEASDSWREPPSSYAEFTPFDKLLEAGFDGYYGSFFNLKDWNAQQLIEHIDFNYKLLNSFPEQKSVILSFTTHDEVSPVVLHGENYSIMIAWLEATLPFNPYCVDGFYTGDKYIYPWENAKAEISATDDDFYFVHRGKLDLFNFSRKPDGKNETINKNYREAMKYRQDNISVIADGGFIPLKTNDSNVFAYARQFENKKILVFGNLNYDKSKSVVIKDIKPLKLSKFKGFMLFPVHCNKLPKVSRKKINVDLEPGEIKIVEIVNVH